MMNKYEMMFIVKANADEKAITNTAKSLKDIITTMKGKITNEQDLGSKELAYPIKKENVGYYFVVNFEATAEIVAELDRKARIDESVLRHLIIRLDEE
jgi:small subunit ribosomal protein S6